MVKQAKDHVCSDYCTSQTCHVTYVYLSWEGSWHNILTYEEWVKD